MTGLTIWEQRALAGKKGVSSETGYTEIFCGCHNSEDIIKQSKYYGFFVYWDNKSLNDIFKFLYAFKFWIGRFSGQVLPSPLWGLLTCEFVGLTNFSLSKTETRQDISNSKSNTYNRSFYKFIQRTGKLLLITSGAVGMLLFDSFNYWHNNGSGIPNEEIFAVSQILGINSTNRNRYRSSSHHTLPRNGLTPLIFVVVGMILFMAVGTFSDNIFNLSDYLINQVRATYGVTDFWNELWADLSLPGNSPLINNDIYLVLFLSLIIWIVIGLFELFLVLLSVGISLKIVFRLRESRFSESVCVLESLRILVELEREDALNSPLQKRYLMIRMNYLSSMSLFIPNNYLGNRYRKEWVNNQFKSISAFIQDRQSWLYAPGQDTLQDLRHDFHMLAQMYIDGSYGTFPRSGEFWPIAVPVRRQWLRDIARLIGFLIPLGLIISILIFPDSLPPFLQSPEIQDAFIWVGTAWLFIGIDRYLNFGVLDSIVDLASGLKGLK